MPSHQLVKKIYKLWCIIGIFLTPKSRYIFILFIFFKNTSNLIITNIKGKDKMVVLWKLLEILILNSEKPSNEHHNHLTRPKTSPPLWLPQVLSAPPPSNCPSSLSIFPHTFAQYIHGHTRLCIINAYIIKHIRSLIWTISLLSNGPRPSGPN